MFNKVFDIPQDDGIIYTPGRPRQYRSDCKAGQFKIGENNMVGQKLQMEILDWKEFYGELFGYEWQGWIQVIFVDKENVVSEILFKTESMGNFQDYEVELKAKRVAMGSQIITAQMSKRIKDAGNYYAVEFSHVPNKPERIQQLYAFAEEFQPYSARIRPLVESTKLTLPSAHVETLEEAEAAVAEITGASPKAIAPATITEDDFPY